MLLQGQINLHGSIYKVFTGSNQSLFFDLQGFYRVKGSLPFSIYNVITRSNRSLVFDLQGFYRVKSVSLLRFTRFLQDQISLPFLIFGIFTMLNDSIPFRFTRFLHNNYNVAVNYPV